MVCHEREIDGHIYKRDENEMTITGMLVHVSFRVWAKQTNMTYATIKDSVLPTPPSKYLHEDYPKTESGVVLCVREA